MSASGRPCGTGTLAHGWHRHVQQAGYCNGHRCTAHRHLRVLRGATLIKKGLTYSRGVTVSIRIQSVTSIKKTGTGLEEGAMVS